MTASNVVVPGPRRLVGLTPADTNEATMLTAGADGTVVVELWITNLTGTAANATVKWGDGSTDFAVIDTYSVAARMFLHEPVLLPLRKDWTIKVTSGTNSALAFTIVVVEYPGGLGGKV